jgi:hypothetical protein
MYIDQTQEHVANWKTNSRFFCHCSCWIIKEKFWSPYLPGCSCVCKCQVLCRNHIK